MARLIAIALLAFFSQAADVPLQGPSVRLSHGDLRVSENRRYLVHKDGTPFFYLGCTAWEIFHRLNREEAEKYLENRRQKGYTVIQAVVLAELDGVHDPNPYGQKPLIDGDPARPNLKYFPDGSERAIRSGQTSSGSLGGIGRPTRPAIHGAA